MADEKTGPSGDGLGGEIPGPGVQPDGFDEIGELEERPLDPAFLSPDAPENRPGGGAAGEATSPAVPVAPPPAEFDWSTVDPETAALAKAKGWKDPADMARGYAEIEKLAGRHGNERQAWDQERQEMLAAVRDITKARQEPVAPPALPEGPQSIQDIAQSVNWSEFDEMAGDDFGSAFKLYTAAVLPSLVESEVQRRLEPMRAELQPLQQMTRGQDIAQAAGKLQAAYPTVWPTVQDRVGEILDTWATETDVTADMIPVAFSYAVSEALESAAAPNGNGAEPAAIPTPVDAAAAAPVAVPTGDELRPLTGGGPAPTAPRDVAGEIRDAIRNSVPTVRDGL